MFTFIFLLLSAVCISIYFWNSKQDSLSAANRYRKRKVTQHSSKQHRSTSLSNESIESRLSAKNPSVSEEKYDADYDDVDYDDALGLRVPQHKYLSHVRRSFKTNEPDFVIALYLMAPDNAPFSGYESRVGNAPCAGANSS